MRPPPPPNLSLRDTYPCAPTPCSYKQSYERWGHRLLRIKLSGLAPHEKDPRIRCGGGGVGDKRRGVSAARELRCEILRLLVGVAVWIWLTLGVTREQRPHVMGEDCD